METPPRQLILSLFGLYARSEGNWLSVRALIALMAELGVDSAAVRSSVSRLKKRSVLESQPHDGQAGYAVSPGTVELLRAGDARIWSRPRATPEDGWLMVLFSVPESERAKRHALRSLLTRLGFGTASSGVWIAPGTVYDEAFAALDRAGLAAYTEFFRGDYLGSGDVAARMRQWWDLDELERLYAEFCAAYRSVAEATSVESPTAVDPAAAFRTYVPMLTAWRRLPYLDPGLPLAYLPNHWPGIEAAEVFADLDARLREPAGDHARAIAH